MNTLHIFIRLNYSVLCLLIWKNFLVFFCDSSLLIWIIPLSIPDKNICDLYVIVALFIKLHLSDIESTEQ